MEKKTLIYKKFKVDVFGKVGANGFTPLRFNVYYKGKLVNGSIKQSLLDKIEEGINEEFNNSRELFNQ